MYPYKLLMNVIPLESLFRYKKSEDRATCTVFQT